MIRARHLAALLSLASCAQPGGETLGAFEAETAEGHTLRVPADPPADLLILHFWSSECPYCKGELEDLEELSQELPRGQVSVLGSNVGDSREVAAGIQKELELTFPILLDPSSDRAKRFGVAALPTTLFFDRRGVIRRKLHGATDAETFRREVEALLR